MGQNYKQRGSKARFELSDRRRLTWYAAVFNLPTTITEPDGKGGLVRYEEVILPGAFDGALASDDDVIANVDHDDAQAFATRSSGQLLLQSDPYGLFCSAWVPDTPQGDGILENVRSGKLDGCSFRFVPQVDRNEGGIVQRAEVLLHDVCLTANPAYPGTEVHLRTQSQFPFLKARRRYLTFKIRKHNTR